MHLAAAFLAGMSIMFLMAGMNCLPYPVVIFSAETKVHEHTTVCIILNSIFLYDILHDIYLSVCLSVCLSVYLSDPEH